MTQDEVLLDGIQKMFSTNFKSLLDKEKLTQKELAAKLKVLESTVSKCNKKLPSTEFLIKLKKAFPQISIDQMLFGESDSVNKNSAKLDNSLLRDRISKFSGVYYVYYLDTNKKRLIGEDRSVDPMIKVGLIYIFDEILVKPVDKACCIAIFGLKKRIDAEKIKEETKGMSSYQEILAYLRKYWGRHLYVGTFDVSQSHMFISTEQDGENKDKSLIVMHHTPFNNKKYIGGLGTINSTSTGRPSDPVVQVGAISREKINLSDEELFSKLLFFKPTINLEPEIQEILNLSQKLYERKNTMEESGSLNDREVFEKYIPQIIESNINRLLRKNIERNTLWFGKISGDADQEWYEKLKQQNSNESEM